jgi:hypothetical protein
MQTAPNFAWQHELLIPAFFTLFGAALGYFTSIIRDERKAKRDKKAFLRAVGMELDALRHQLDVSQNEVNGSRERVMGGGETGPQIAATLRTGVFGTQVAKLRDVDDQLLIDIIHFYSDLGTVQRIVEMVNDLGAEFNRGEAFSGQKEKVRPQLLSALIALQEEISKDGNRLIALRAKLP